ncbi:MAG: IS200/IS605 family accessory protein TnpB-related protein [Nitrosotalea sp.]
MTTIHKIIKSVKQDFTPNETILKMMEIFRCMVNHCIRIGLENDATTLKRLSNLAYYELRQYDILSYYKIHAISRATGILSNRKQSIKRGIVTKNPYLEKHILVSCYGFKLENKIFKIPLGNKTYLNILLNHHTKQILSDPNIEINSFTLTFDSICISYSKLMEKIECTSTAGIDRNLRNLTYGNCEKVIQFDLSKTVQISDNTKSICSGFKRNDNRIRKRIYSKYGKRKKNRVNQILHKVSKSIVEYAYKRKEAVVFEDIRYIRRMYRKGNGQGKKYRGRLNGWSFGEIKRQIEYKARWNGIPVIQLSKSETRGTSTLCPTCGKRLQDQRTWNRSDHNRELWCDTCQRWLDRDVVAVMNQSLRGLSRLDSSRGVAGEAMVQEFGVLPVILKVDATKSLLHIMKC